MIKIALDIDIMQIIRTQAGLTVLNSKGLPNTQHGLSEVAKFTKNEWQRQAMTMIKHSTGGYVQGIIIEENPDELWSQVINRSPIAFYLEEGTKSFDMKKMLQTSHQVRVNKKGKKYLIIPFRHLTPGEFKKGELTEQRATGRSMPESIYEMAQELAMSNVTGMFYEKSKQLVSTAQARKTIAGAPAAQRWNYTWGNRGKGFGGIYEGMVRFQTTGGGSRYLTFRTMSENSAGWIHPGIQAKHIAQQTAEIVKPKALEYLKKQFQKDVDELRSVGA